MNHSLHVSGNIIEMGEREKGEEEEKGRVRGEGERGG